MLQTHNLAFSYNHLPFLENLSLQIKAGECVAIIGPNGSGKSTLIKLLAGILHPRTGMINITGQDLSMMERRIAAGKIAYVPQNVDIPFGFSVWEVVHMGRFPHAGNLLVLTDESKQAVENALNVFDLEPLAQRNFGALSGGEKQRVIVASALAQDSPLMLLDEPTSALDLKYQQTIYKTLLKLCRENDKTVVVVTHDVNLAAQYCDRLILLHCGKVIRDGVPEEVLKFPVIQEVYGVKVFIDINPFTKSLYILPYDVN